MWLHKKQFLSLQVFGKAIFWNIRKRVVLKYFADFT